MKVPSKKKQRYRIIIESIALLIISYPLIHIYVFMSGKKQPFHRGFFCDDENLKHPILIENQTLPMINCGVIWACIGIIIIVTLEIFLFMVYKSKIDNEESLCKIPPFTLELFRILWFFVLGAIFTLLVTEVAKFSIGRLRPHWITLLIKECGFKLDNNTCKDEFSYEKFVSPTVCEMSGIYSISSCLRPLWDEILNSIG